MGGMANFGSTISYVNNGYANPSIGSIINGPKFADPKTLRLKRRNITITDGVTTPATFFTPAKTPKTPNKGDDPAAQF